MANGGDLRFTAAAGASSEQESPMVPPPTSEIPTANNPPPRSTAPSRANLTEKNHSLLNAIRSFTTLTPQERKTCLQSLFNLMTRENSAAQFREVVFRLDGDGSDLWKMASLLTSDAVSLFGTARYKNGSNRMQELLGKSDDVDTFFFNAIMLSFFRIMTDLNASRVGMQGMRVFSQEKKTAMYDYVVHHALQMALHQDGNFVLSEIITEWSGMDHSFIYRDQLLYVVVQNALSLSYHAHGNYVVQHVLQLNDLRCTNSVSVSLSGHCVRLSFTKLGSYVVEKLLNTEEAAVMVVGELLGCDGDSLVNLAWNEFGNYVVMKALLVMQERNNKELFWGLVNKLMPYVNLFRGRNIGALLDSLH